MTPGGGLSSWLVLVLRTWASYMLVFEGGGGGALR